MTLDTSASSSPADWREKAVAAAAGSSGPIGKNATETLLTFLSTNCEKAAKGPELDATVDALVAAWYAAEET